MTRLEDLQPHAAVRGLLPDALATVVGVQWHGSDVVEVTFKDPAGRVANELLYRDGTFEQSAVSNAADVTIIHELPGC
jgi:hypothetical protein